jgi:hypothetical protein
MARLGVLVLVLAGGACEKKRTEQTAPTTPSPAPAPEREQRALAEPKATAVGQEVFARALCDWFWRSSVSSARMYDSLEECIALQTKPRACTDEQARACALYMRDAQPGTGEGLNGNLDCAACLTPTHDPVLEAEIAAQRAALERAKLVVHSAAIQTTWPETLEALRDASKVLVMVDVEMTGYGYRIDPDDFELLSAAPPHEAITGIELAERLTRAGQPVAWTDPEVVNDPDLRIRAYFVIPAAMRGTSAVIDFEGKRSAPFSIR